MPSVNPIVQKAMYNIGRPVGVSLRNGQGVSGVLCNVQNDQIFLLQYLYASQFATFHYRINEIADILPYPSCQ
ncbi:hypothetical protein [Paenibacillus prosopidis]|nr:hypothetical protein [Paenibacillus prosopidis]